MRNALKKPLHFLAFEDIVRWEVRRIGRVPGHDREDLIQEARFAVSKALRVFDAERENTGRTFVSTAVRNKLCNLKRAALSQGRVPHDERGRETAVHSLDTPATETGEVTFLDRLQGPGEPESEASAIELVRALDARLSKAEMSLLVGALVQGAEMSTARARGKRVSAEEIERVRRVARDALLRLLGQRRMLTSIEHRVDTDADSMEDEEMPAKTTKKVALPVVKPADLPECHASLPTGPGYDANEPGCRDQCPDKFSCVRDLVGDKEKNTSSLTLGVDTEVEAVLAGVITYDDAIERMKRRDALVKSGGSISDDLSTTKKIELAPEPEPEPAPEPEAEEASADEPTNETNETDETETTTEQTEEDDAMATKKSAKKVAKKAAAKKSASPPPKAAKAAKKATTKKAARASTPRIPKEKRVSIYSDGQRFLPQPRTLDTEQFDAALGRIKLGQTFDLAVGMEIVRKKRDGSEVVVKIAKDGFVMDGVTYPSLSAAGQWASKRAVSGNDFFNCVTYSCTEIRGKAVPGGVFSKQGEGKPAVVGAHGAKEEKPKKKAAKKAAAKKAPPPPKAAKKAAKKKASKK